MDAEAEQCACGGRQPNSVTFAVHFMAWMLAGSRELLPIRTETLADRRTFVTGNMPCQHVVGGAASARRSHGTACSQLPHKSDEWFVAASTCQKFSIPHCFCLRKAYRTRHFVWNLDEQSENREEHPQSETCLSVLTYAGIYISPCQ